MNNDMNAVKSEPLPEGDGETFQKIVIPDVPDEIPGETVSEGLTNPQDILADIQGSEDGISPIPDDTELNQLDVVSEKECAMLLHAVYGLAAFMLKGQEPPDETIQWRGKQMYLIMVKYNLQVKYLDLAFFGLGVSSDLLMIYSTRKKPEKKEDDVIPGGE